MEILKDIIGYEGLYQASSLGKIKSLIGRYSNVEYLKEGTTKCNYKTVTLCKNNKHTSKNVHRLIAEAFYGKSKLDVNHKDGDKTNNKIENLEFVTKSENIKHALKKGLFIPNFDKIAIETRKKIAQINIANDGVINIFVSAHEASRQTKINRGNISATCRGLYETAGGYKWKYI